MPAVGPVDEARMQLAVDEQHRPRLGRERRLAGRGEIGVGGQDRGAAILDEEHAIRLHRVIAAAGAAHQRADLDAVLHRKADRTAVLVIHAGIHDQADAAVDALYCTLEGLVGRIARVDGPQRQIGAIQRHVADQILHPCRNFAAAEAVMAGRQRRHALQPAEQAARRDQRERPEGSQSRHRGSALGQGSRLGGPRRRLSCAGAR